MEMIGKCFKFIFKTMLFMFAGLGAFLFLGMLTLGIVGYKAVDKLSANFEHFEEEFTTSFMGKEAAAKKLTEVPGATILKIDLRKTIVDQRDFSPIALVLPNKSIVLHDLVSSIDEAAKDARVKALYAEIGGDHIGIAHIQEIRDAVMRFNATGKKSVIYSQSIGDAGSGTQSYYLSSAFGEIVLQPMGAVNLIGMMSATPFARGTFDKIGVVPDIYHRGEYKSAPNTYTEYDFTAEQKEMMQDVLENITTQELDDLKIARPQISQRRDALYNGGPYLAKEALDKKLIDRIAYQDQVEKALKDQFGDKVVFVSFEKYGNLRAQELFNKDASKIAIITAEGTIVSEQGNEPAYQKDRVSVKAIEEQFKRAADDDQIKAVIFRVNSPGGSPVASEAIRHQLLEFKKTGKPVIVSMGNYAASGGYWISMDADRIVAQPATLTGSIGVFAGKFSTEGFWQKLGITWGVIGVGDNAGFFSHLKPYNDTEKSRLDEQLDFIYQSFVKYAAKARGMTESKLSLYAEGRVWTGQEALKIGLVDALGGFDVATDEIFKMLEVKNAAGKAKFTMVDMSVQPSPFNFFLDFLDMQMKGQQIINRIWPALPLTEAFDHQGVQL